VRFFARSLAPIALLSAASLFFAEAAWAGPITVDIVNGEMNFGATSGTNQPSKIGDAATEGFSHRYDDVFAGVDAVATVIDIDNLDSDDNEANGQNLRLDEFDDSDLTTGKQIDLGLDVFGNSDSSPPEVQTGFVTFRIDFVEADTNDAATLQNISMRIDDIDSNQFAKFAGISAYELSATPATELTVTSTGGAYEFKEPVGASSSSSHQENWVVVEYASASSITITLGAREAGGRALVSHSPTQRGAPPQLDPRSVLPRTV
jgi:hypothetical protein